MNDGMGVEWNRHRLGTGWLIARLAFYVAAPLALLSCVPTNDATAPLATPIPTPTPPSPPVVHFVSDVQPILAQHCFPCHGSDEAGRKAGLRLDTPQGMFSPRPSGTAVITKGDPDGSLLMRRISAIDPSLRMPPPTVDWSLSPADVATVRNWIAGGAEFPVHWAYQNPERPRTPPVADAGWAKQPLDLFVLAGLQAAGRQPAPEAERRALIRRASLDARGLPPTPEEVDVFLADDAGDAYERLIDRLLADPAYGEHRATAWLDVARYADTHGFEFDNFRSIWPYRDYVVRAFNDNMRFDRFTVEQLAGDLLPDATLDQQVATGFGRCAMSTGEGGAIEDEFAAIAAKDRVETVAATWMGLTLGCAACHDHKFDPLTQKDFYRMAAFFRNTTQPVFDANRSDVPPVVMAGPDLATPTLVTVENSTAPFAYVLRRGQYDQLGDRVTPDVPSSLPGLPPGATPNRLGLARWLISPDNPLTARVVVNRFWAEVFGAGIVTTPDNFGTTGALPTNQDLLDWLAVEFRASGWDIKHMFRLVLSSATYRQSANHTPDGDAVDPENHLLWHGPHYRMEPELVRDQALAASGLLVNRLGGPPVKPYQPAGVWEAVAIDESNTAVYQRDSGDALYRRSLYTFWKRAAPPPFMQIFNAPTREGTVSQRERTNTPLQALALMNDPQMLEAARHLAINALQNRGDVGARLDYMGIRVLARPFDVSERAALGDSLNFFLQRYQSEPEAAAQLLMVGDSPVDPAIPTPTQAAWMMVAHEILNLDESLTK